MHVNMCIDNKAKGYYIPQSLYYYTSNDQIIFGNYLLGKYNRAILLKWQESFRFQKKSNWLSHWNVGCPQPKFLKKDRRQSKRKSTWLALAEATLTENPAGAFHWSTSSREVQLTNRTELAVTCHSKQQVKHWYSWLKWLISHNC